MNRSLSADTILKQAQPITDQHSFEIQPFGHLVRMPIALDENVCRESVENLNQVLADTLTLRDMSKNITGRSPGRRSTSFTCSSISTTKSRAISPTRSRSGFRFSAA